MFTFFSDFKQPSNKQSLSHACVCVGGRGGVRVCACMCECVQVCLSVCLSICLCERVEVKVEGDKCAIRKHHLLTYNYVEFCLIHGHIKLVGFFLFFSKFNICPACAFFVCVCGFFYIPSCLSLYCYFRPQQAEQRLTMDPSSCCHLPGAWTCMYIMFFYHCVAYFNCIVIVFVSYNS